MSGKYRQKCPVCDATLYICETTMLTSWRSVKYDGTLSRVASKYDEKNIKQQWECGNAHVFPLGRFYLSQEDGKLIVRDERMRGTDHE